MSKASKSFGLVPRTTRWGASGADAFFGYLLHDGSGAILTEVAGAANSDDYTGTALVRNEYGIEPVGDGAAVLPAAVNSVFQMQQECRVLVSCWVTTQDTSMTSQDRLLAVGVDNGTAGNFPSGGHLRLVLIAGLGSIAPIWRYRNASTDAAAPAEQEITTATAIGAASYTRHHLALILHSNGSDVDYRAYVDGATANSGSFTNDGLGAINLPSAGKLCAVGGSLVNANTANNFRAAVFLGANTNSALQALMLWRKNDATEAETVALMHRMRKNRAEAPF